MRITDIPDDKLYELAGIHTRLSPESLTGDGEIPAESWQRTKAELEAQLLALQRELGLSQDDAGECAVYAECDRRLDLRRRGRRPRI